MNSFLSLWWDRFHEERDLAVICRELAMLDRGKESQLPTDYSEVPVLRVPTPPRFVLSIDWAVGETPRFRHRRRWTELFTGAPRIYIADPMPGAMFGKPILAAVFVGFSRRPVYLQWGNSHPIVHGAYTPILQPRAALAWAVQGRPALLALPVLPEIFPPMAPPKGPPLSPGGFPGTDLPVPVPATPWPNPTPIGAAPGLSSTRQLFYGLCFQSERWDADNGDLSATGKKEPLAGETRAVATMFEMRSYRTAIAEAGREGIGANSTANTFEEMMASLATDIAALTPAFGTTPSDEMVIFVAAHGYRPGDPNHTGDVAMLFQPDQRHEFVTYGAFLNRLLAIPAIAANPTKAVLIFYSCRSGRIWEGGVIPRGLAGMHVITATDIIGHYTFTGTFATWLIQAMNGNAATNWNELVTCLKWFGRLAYGITPTPGKGAIRPPRNGDLHGCRAVVELTSINYVGPNIGKEWEFTVQVSADISFTNYDGTTQTITTAAAPVLQSEKTLALGLKTYAPAVPLYDAMWKPCAPNNNVTLNISIQATQYEGINDTANSPTNALTFVCNAATPVPAKTVRLAVTDSPTIPFTNPTIANVDLTFSVTTSCL